MPIYPEIYDGPPKGYGSTPYNKYYIAIHNTSNDATAKEEASYAKRRTDSVSSHYYMDKIQVIQSLNTDLSAWHAGSSIGNRRAIAYEITGTNGKSRAWWLANVAWDKLAASIARDCKRWGIKPRTLTDAQLKAGTETGIITHDQMRRVWGGTTHTDPGPGFPMDYLIQLVVQALIKLNTPPQPAFPPYPGHPLEYIPGQVKYDSAAKQWQQKMDARGWTIDVDGLYGPGSKAVCIAFQREKGLKPDGIVGPITWAATWSLPVT